MKQRIGAIAPTVLLFLAASCGGGDDGGGLGGAGGGRDDSGAPATGGSGAIAGSGGASGSSGSSGVGGSAGASAGGVGGGAGGNEGGTGGIVGAGGTGAGGDGTGGTATGGTGASGGTGGTDATGGSAGTATGGSGGGVTPAITAVAWLQPDSCERFAAYEVRDVRDQDGLPVTDYTCEWTFSDGGVANTCTGNHLFGALPDTHHGTVVVRDSRTGATTTATSEAVLVIEPQALEIFVVADECMQFSYDIDRQYGCGGTHTFDIQPAENILTPGPWSMESQTLQVSTPGVYTLRYAVDGCAASYARSCPTSTTASVTVAACP